MLGPSFELGRGKDGRLNRAKYRVARWIFGHVCCFFRLQLSFFCFVLLLLAAGIDKLP